MAPTWLSRLERIKPSFTALAAPPTFVSCPYRSRRGRSLLEGRRYARVGAARSLATWGASVTAKAELRAEARALRKRLAEADPSAALRLADHADSLPPGDPVALYAAVGSELDPAPLARALLAAGRSLCLPVAVERDAAMIFRRWAPGEPLELDAAGCPAPLPLAETVKPALILTPLLAFDDHGGRLGQGGGFYDRTFAAMPDIARIGLAYAGQAVGPLPMERHDMALDGVLTETGYRPCRKV